MIIKVEENFGYDLPSYLRDSMLAPVFATATCLSVRLSVRPPRAGIVSKRRKFHDFFTNW